MGDVVVFVGDDVVPALRGFEKKRLRFILYGFALYSVNGRFREKLQ